MANLARLRLPGFWIAGSVVDPDEFEAFDEMRPLLINAEDGSTHAPTAPIIIGGSGVNTTGPLDVDGDLEQDAGSEWSMSGDTIYGAGSEVTYESASTQVMESGSLLQIDSGADVAIAGDMTWGASNWPKLSSRSIERNKWRLAMMMYTEAPGAGPDGPVAWLSQDISGTMPAVMTAALTSQLLRFVVELLELPPGATLSSVTITTRGITGDSDVDLPTYQLIRWNGATYDNMSVVTTDGHTGANWTSSDVDTVIAPNAHSTIDGAYNYGILVLPPAGTTPASMYMNRFKATLNAARIQL